jgi:ABC-type amino acid transport system permease subunit
MNQTGQAIEGVAIIMAVFLTHQPVDLGVHELVQPRTPARPGR